MDSLTVNNVLNVGGNTKIDANLEITGRFRSSGSAEINGSLNVAGIATFAGVIQGNSGADLADINVGTGTSTSKIVTTAGNLTLDSATGLTRVEDNLDVVGSVSATLVSAPNLPPIGSIITWAGNTSAIPANWLVCNGATVSQSTYQTLYNTLTNNGTTFPYGTNPTGSTFRLPNLTDRFVITAGNLYNLGGTGGNKDAEVITHTHTANASTVTAHTHNVNPAGDHNHTVVAVGNHSHTVDPAGAHNHTNQGAGGHTHNTSTAPNHTHTIVAANAPHGHNASSGAANAPHSHTYQSSGAVEFGNRTQNAKFLVSRTWITVAANAPHAHPVSVAANNAPHAHNMDGAGSHAHNISTVVDHSHIIDPAGTHTHTTQGAGGHAHNADPAGTHNHTTGTAGGHTHTITNDPAGVSGTNRNLPPYLGLFYIIRVPLIRVTSNK